MLGHETVSLVVVSPLPTLACLALEGLESICLLDREVYADGVHIFSGLLV